MSLENEGVKSLYDYMVEKSFSYPTDRDILRHFKYLSTIRRVRINQHLQTYEDDLRYFSLKMAYDRLSNTPHDSSSYKFLDSDSYWNASSTSSSEIRRGRYWDDDIGSSSGSDYSNSASSSGYADRMQGMGEDEFRYVKRYNPSNASASSSAYLSSGYADRMQGEFGYRQRSSSPVAIRKFGGAMRRSKSKSPRYYGAVTRFGRRY